MSEDHFIVIGSKKIDSKRPAHTAQFASLSDDLNIFLKEESRERFVDSALLQGTSHRLIHRFETWKTHDDLNFVKVSDVTQVVDFKGTTKTEKGIAHEKEGSFESTRSPGTAHLPTAGQIGTVRSSMDKTTEEAVVHALVHGSTKCNTTVAFTEAFH